MSPLLSITSHFFLQIAVTLLTYRLLWPVFRQTRSGAGGRDHGRRIPAWPFSIGVDMAGWAAMAVPREADHRGRNVTHPNLTVIYVVGQLGLVLYMFLVGASFKLDILGAHVRQAGVTSAAGIGVPLVLGGVVGWCMVSLGGYFTDKVVHWQGGLFVAAAVAITAFPMLAWIICDSGLLNTRLGRWRCPAAAVDDACAWVLLATVVATAKGSGFGAFLAIGGGGWSTCCSWSTLAVRCSRDWRRGRRPAPMSNVRADYRRAHEHHSSRRADRELVHRCGRNLFRIRRFRGWCRHATRCAARGDPRAVRTVGRIPAVTRVLHLFGAEH